MSCINTIWDFECRRMDAENQFHSFQSLRAPRVFVKRKCRQIAFTFTTGAFRFHYRRRNGNEWGASDSKWTLQYPWILSIRRILNFHYRYFHLMEESNMKLFIASFTTSAKRFFVSRLTQFLIFFFFSLFPNLCHCWKFFFHEFLMLCKWFMTFFIML